MPIVPVFFKLLSLFHKNNLFINFKIYCILNLFYKKKKSKAAHSRLKPATFALLDALIAKDNRPFIILADLEIKEKSFWNIDLGFILPKAQMIQSPRVY